VDLHLRLQIGPGIRPSALVARGQLGGGVAAPLDHPVLCSAPTGLLARTRRRETAPPGSGRLRQAHDQDSPRIRGCCLREKAKPQEVGGHRQASAALAERGPGVTSKERMADPARVVGIPASIRATPEQYTPAQFADVLEASEASDLVEKWRICSSLALSVMSIDSAMIAVETAAVLRGDGPRIGEQAEDHRQVAAGTGHSWA